MDFQGQGLANTGETEALALIDSFTKTVILIPLPDRQASTLVPRLLDELHFRRGSPDVLHSDDALEFLRELMTAVANVTGTQRTSTCGHNPQSNGEIESWWRFWNRAMRYLSQSQYETWPLYAQRICYAYNSVPHDSIAQLSPFEMDFAFPPNSPFGPPDPALSLCDQIDPPDFNPTALVSPADFAAALPISHQEVGDVGGVYFSGDGSMIAGWACVFEDGPSIGSEPDKTKDCRVQGRIGGAEVVDRQVVLIESENFSQVKRGVGGVANGDDGGSV
jgi:hypothetical protein